MNNQSTKIITCLVAGFILSACVGSVSVPASETKKTDDPEAQKMAEVETETEKMDEPKIPPPNPCIANPFGDGCNDYTRQSFCGIRANAGDNRCATILGRTNMATWLQSFIIPLRTTAAEGNNQTSFLRVGADNAIDTTGIAIRSTDAKELTRAGDSNDGVQFFKGTPDRGTAEHFFAGILPTTDLGLPVPQTEPEATWTGSYQRAGTGIVNDVSFAIDFENRTIYASTNLADSNDFDNLSGLESARKALSRLRGFRFVSAGELKFNLNFTASGVIDGAVVATYGESAVDSADATGLIGQDGLVGAFVDATTGARGLQNFYGGFWAEPPSE